MIQIIINDVKTIEIIRSEEDAPKERLLSRKSQQGICFADKEEV